jgi:hypothetical protein
MKEGITETTKGRKTEGRKEGRKEPSRRERRKEPRKRRREGGQTERTREGTEERNDKGRKGRRDIQFLVPTLTFLQRCRNAFRLGGRK